MRLVVDAQLPPALACWLAQQGHEAEHLFDRFPPGTTDTAIWHEAPRIVEALERGELLVEVV